MVRGALSCLRPGWGGVGLEHFLLPLHPLQEHVASVLFLENSQVCSAPVAGRREVLRTQTPLLRPTPALSWRGGDRQEFVGFLPFPSSRLLMVQLQERCSVPSLGVVRAGTRAPALDPFQSWVVFTSECSVDTGMDGPSAP